MAKMRVSTPFRWLAQFAGVGVPVLAGLALALVLAVLAAVDRGRP